MAGEEIQCWNHVQIYSATWDHNLPIWWEMSFEFQHFISIDKSCILYIFQKGDEFVEGTGEGDVIIIIFFINFYIVFWTFHLGIYC